MNDRDRDDLLSTATDRFERRLAEECGQVRTQIGELRDEMGRLRVDMVSQGADIRLEVAKSRLDFSEQFGAFRTDAAQRHHELLKWALVFWVGQAAAVAGILASLR